MKFLCHSSTPDFLFNSLRETSGIRVSRDKRSSESPWERIPDSTIIELTWFAYIRLGTGNHGISTIRGRCRRCGNSRGMRGKIKRRRGQGRGI
jgi:hypothetical protein